MTRFTTLLPRIVVAALTAAALYGCAVMTIDVDVYKGPLANHEDVQVEQMATMAIGAKPLLVQLRDRLEVPNDEAREAWQRGNGTKSPLHSDAWISPAAGRLDNDLARTVNDVLELYENSRPSLGGAAGQLLRETLDAWSRYREARDAFLRTGVDATEEWKQLAELMNDDYSLPAGAGTAEDQAAMNAALATLKDGYKTFLKPQDSPFRTWFGIANAMPKLADIDTKMARSAQEWKSLQPDGKLRYSRSNIFYDRLSDPDLLKGHARTLFHRDQANASAEQERVRDEFIDTIRTIVRAFRDAREARAVMLRALCSILVEVDPKSDVRAERLLAELTIKALPEFVDIQALTVLMQIATDKDSTAEKKLPAPVRRLLETLEAENGQLLTKMLDDTGFTKEEPLRESAEGDEPVKDRPQSKEDALEAARSSLKAVIEREPRDVAFGLLLAHEIYAAPDFIDKATSNKTNIKRLGGRGLDDERVRKFGLASGFTYWAQDTEIDAFKDEEFAKLAKQLLVISSALGGGRLEQGLEALIDTYVTAAYENGGDPNGRAGVARERDRLADALVRFAEKLRFVANNTADRGPEYTRTLQAVGNSLLNQADELRQRRSHEKRLKDSALREANALRASLSIPSAQTVDELLIELNARKSAADTNIGDLTPKITALETEVPKRRQELTRLENLGPAQQDEVEIAAKAVVAARAAYDTAQSAAAVLTQAPLNQVHTSLADDDTPIKWTDYKQALNAQLVKAISGALAGPNPDEPRIAALQQARKTYDALTFSPPDAKPAAMYEALELELATDVVTKHGVLSDKKKTLAGAEEKSNALDAKKAAATTAYSAAQTQLTTLRAAQVAETALKTRYAHAVDCIEAVRDAATRMVAAGEATDVLQAIVAKVKATQKTDEAKAATIKVIGEINRQPSLEIAAGSPTAESGDTGENAKDVLDRLIAALRHEQIRAVNQYGSGSVRAQQVTAALEIAHQQRASKVFIRPPAAYLRSSYAATSLQADPGLAWNNMLGEQAWRGAGFGAPSNRQARNDRKKRAEIDKVFWQNINRVRVAGAGTTNYVVAKDDIGNWYVKQYSANPEPIIEAAESLAMFNLGAQMGTDLLSRTRQARAGQPVTPSAGAQRNSVERIFDKYRTEYDARTLADFQQLAKDLDENLLRTRLASAYDVAWGQVTSDDLREPALDAIKQKAIEAENPHLLNAKSAMTDALGNDDRGARIVTALQAVRRYHNDVQRRVSAQDVTQPAADAVAAKEADLAREQSVLDDRRRAHDAAAADLEAKNAARNRAHETLTAVNGNPNVTEAERQSARTAATDADGAAASAAQTVQEAANSVAEAGQRVDAATSAVAQARTMLDAVRSALATSRSDTTLILGDWLRSLAGRRKNATQDFETAIIFVGDAVGEQQ